MLLGNCFGHPAMMIVLLAHDDDIEALAREALHDTVEFRYEGADEIVKQIDPALGKALLGVFIEAMKSKHEPVALPQSRDIV